MLMKIIFRFFGFLVLLVYRAIYFGTVRFNIMAVLEGGLTLIVNSKGSLLAGKIKLRGGAKIYIDGGSVIIHDDVFLNSAVSINSRESISIGCRTLLGEGVKIYDHDHLFLENGTVSHGEFTCKAVQIGEGCWLGSNVMILKGVSICDNVIIGAGAIVTKSINEPGVYVPVGCGLRKVR